MEPSKEIPQIKLKVSVGVQANPVKEEVQRLYNLGNSLLSQADVPLNLAQAHECFYKAARLRHAPSMCALGRMHLKGKGCVQDFSAAYRWISSAAMLHHPEALYQLGRIYLSGKAVTQDIARARHYFECAELLGCKKAYLKLEYIDLRLLA